MPYFLVTQTTLVEAEDENGAAEQTIVKLSQSAAVAFDVRSDIGPVARVVMARQRIRELTGRAERSALEQSPADVERPLASVGASGWRLIVAVGFIGLAAGWMAHQI